MNKEKEEDIRGINETLQAKVSLKEDKMMYARKNLGMRCGHEGRVFDRCRGHDFENNY